MALNFVCSNLDIFSLLFQHEGYFLPSQTVSICVIIMLLFFKSITLHRNNKKSNIHLIVSGWYPKCVFWMKLRLMSSLKKKSIQIIVLLEILNAPNGISFDDYVSVENGNLVGILNFLGIVFGRLGFAIKKRFWFLQSREMKNFQPV